MYYLGWQNKTIHQKDFDIEMKQFTHSTKFNIFIVFVNQIQEPCFYWIPSIILHNIAQPQHTFLALKTDRLKFSSDEGVFSLHQTGRVGAITVRCEQCEAKLMGWVRWVRYSRKNGRFCLEIGYWANHDRLNYQNSLLTIFGHILWHVMNIFIV